MPPRQGDENFSCTLCNQYVNPVRNSSGVLNPVRDLSLNGINPALRGGTPYGAEPGIILKSNPAAEQRGIISNGVKAR